MSDFETVPVGTMKELEKIKAERDGWVESSRQFANGQEFYQGIVRQIGGLLGEAAYTSDDGSVQDDVLALKVPELVEALAAHVERLRDAGEKLATELEQWSLTEQHDETDAAFESWSDAVSQQPTDTSLARLKIEWLKGIKQQSRRVRNYSAPDQVFEAIPLIAIDCELRRQAERTIEMNDNCPWRNRLDELLYQLAETIPNLNEPDYYKNELIDRLNELRRQAEEN